MCLQDFFKASSKQLKNIFKRLQDNFKAYCQRQIHIIILVLVKRLSKDVFKIHFKKEYFQIHPIRQFVSKTSIGRFEVASTRFFSKMYFVPILHQYVLNKMNI